MLTRLLILSLLSTPALAGDLHIEPQVGHAGSLKSLAFTPDSKLLVSQGHFDKMVKVWDVSSGRVVWSFTGVDAQVSPSGRWVVSRTRKDWKSQFESVTFFDVRTSARIVTKPTKEREFFKDDFTVNKEESLLGLTGPYEFAIWSLSPKKRLFQIKHGIDEYGAKTGRFHSDGKHFIVAAKKGHAVFSLADGQKVSLEVASELTAKRWPPQDKNRFCRSNCDISAESADGRLRAFKKLSQHREDLIVLEEKTSSTKRVLGTAARAPDMFAVSPDGRWLVVRLYETVKIWDLMRGAPAGAFHVEWGISKTLAFWPDSKRIAMLCESYGVCVFDIPSGKLVKKLGRVKKDVHGNRYRVFHLNKRNKNRSYSIYEIQSVAVHPKGKLIATSTLEDIRIWDWRSGRLKKTIKLDSARKLRFSPDGKWLAWVHNSIGLVRWRKSAKSVIPDVERNRLSDGVPRFAEFDAAGNLFVDQVAFQEVPKIKNPEKLGFQVNAVGVFSSNGVVNREGTWVVSGFKEGALALIDTKTKERKKFWLGHVGYLRGLSFLSGHRLVTAGSDGTIKIWDLKKEEPTAVSLVSSGNEWLMIDQLGYFTASRRGAQLVGATIKGRSYGIDQFAARANRPDIVLPQFGVEDAGMMAHLKARHALRAKRLGLEGVGSIDDSFEVPEVKILKAERQGETLQLKFEAKDKTALKAYLVFVNNVPVIGGGKPLSGKQQVVEEQVTLGAGVNKVEVSVLNSRGAESFRALHEEALDTKPKRRLFFLGFGVSQYADGSLNLKYAHQDALDLSRRFSQMKGKTFDEVLVRTLVNEQVTTKAIEEAKSFLAQSAVDDTVVLFIAGHGIHDSDATATYYYLTHEAQVDQLAQSAANFEQIEDLLQDIKARRKLFLMDTCESGELDDPAANSYFAVASKRLKPRSTRGLRKKIRAQVKVEPRFYLHNRERFVYNDLSRRSGAIVLSSSRGGELSYEDGKYKNGLFTEAVLNALKGRKADIDKNKHLSAEELRSFVEIEVAKLSKGMQHPTVDRDNLHAHFEFPIE